MDVPDVEPLAYISRRSAAPLRHSIVRFRVPAGPSPSILPNCMSPRAITNVWSPATRVVAGWLGV